MAMDCEHTCRVRFLFFDELKLIPLILGSDPLLSQQPGDKNHLTVSGHLSSAEKKEREKKNRSTHQDNKLDYDDLT